MLFKYLRSEDETHQSKTNLKDPKPILVGNMYQDGSKNQMINHQPQPSPAQQLSGHS